MQTDNAPVAATVHQHGLFLSQHGGIAMADRNQDIPEETVRIAFQFTGQQLIQFTIGNRTCGCGLLTFLVCDKIDNIFGLKGCPILFLKSRLLVKHPKIQVGYSKLVKFMT